MQIRRGAAARSAMMAIVATSLLGPAVASADDDPFAMLHERERTWTFELVTGPSLAALSPVTSAPHARCRVAEVTTTDAAANAVTATRALTRMLTRARIECAPVAEGGGAVAPALSQRFTLLFDAAGVREAVHDADDNLAVLAHGSNAGAFTFPRKLARRWRHDVQGPDGARAVVTVREAPAGVGRAPSVQWIAEATYRGPGRDVEPVRAAAAFTPGIGPTLKCTIGRDAGATKYTCLRRIAEPVADPARPRPVAQISVIGKTAHNKSSLSAAAVAAKITASYLPAIRRCYTELLRKKPGARGALQLDFTVNAVGKLAEPRARTIDESLAECVRSAMVGWRFPIPQSEYGEPRDARFAVGLRLTPP
jgi:hypothetical protein